MNLSNKKGLVYDLGLFPENAARLARDCEKIWYFTPCMTDPFPEPFRSLIGRDFDGLERVNYFWDYVDKADFIFVPDTMCRDLVMHLREDGYNVAGAGEAEKLESDRWYTRTKQKELGLPTQTTFQVKGVTALREFCAEYKDYWVKIGTFRGISESFKNIDVKSSESRIDYIAYKLGPLKEEIEFYCEEDKDGEEPGLDGITWDGDLLFPTMAGYEHRGAGYIGRIYESPSDLPVSMGRIHNAFSDEFRRMQTRFFCSAEFKQGPDGDPYLLEFTVRLAAPGVAAIQTELVENYSEVVYGMATGEKTLPVFRAKYAGAASMESSEANKSFLNVSFPKELRKWVKLRESLKHGQDYYAVPGFDSIGTVIALGDSVEEVVGLIKEREKQIHGISLNTAYTEFQEITKDIEKGRKYGIEF